MNNKILMAASYWPHDRKRQPMVFVSTPGVVRLGGLRRILQNAFFLEMVRGDDAPVGKL